MSIPSPEVIEKVLYPKDKRDKVVACVYVFLFFFIPTGVIYIFKELTWTRFLPIIAVLALNIWYVVYDLIHKWRVKPPKGLKEIYESYYWLVTHLDPYKPMMLCSIFKQSGFEFKDNTHIEPPEYFKIVAKEIGYDWEVLLFAPKFFIKFYPEDPSITTTIDVIQNNKEVVFNKLFLWYKNKGVPVLHTKDNKPITSVVALRSLWEDLGLKSEKLDIMNLDVIGEYLYNEHNKILKELNELSEPE